MPFDHLGIAVRSIAASMPRWVRSLGGTPSAEEALESQRVRVAFLDVGSVHLELLEPTEPASPVGRFLERRGEGMHHIAFSVPDVDRKLDELASSGVELVDRVGRPGARGRRVGFAQPSAFGGVLVEFVEGA